MSNGDLSPLLLLPVKMLYYNPAWCLNRTTDFKKLHHKGGKMRLLFSQNHHRRADFNQTAASHLIKMKSLSPPHTSFLNCCRFLRAIESSGLKWQLNGVRVYQSISVCKAERKPVYRGLDSAVSTNPRDTSLELITVSDKHGVFLSNYNITQ